MSGIAIGYCVYSGDRADSQGLNIKKLEGSPLVWESASYEAGGWSDPYFDCGGYVNDWILSYRIPFFGNLSSPEFRYVNVYWYMLWPLNKFPAMVFR